MTEKKRNTRNRSQYTDIVVKEPLKKTQQEEKGNMIGYRELLMQQEYAKELLHQAEKERFLRQVLAGAHRNRLNGRALIWLGSHLVAWGHSLEKRYGAAASAS